MLKSWQGLKLTASTLSQLKNKSTGLVMKDVNLLMMIISSLLSSAFAVGAFYSTTLWRIKRLEQSQANDTDVRERLIAIETKLEILIKDKQ
jgi:hypothetical protein